MNGVSYGTQLGGAHSGKGRWKEMQNNRFALKTAQRNFFGFGRNQFKIGRFVPNLDSHNPINNLKPEMISIAPSFCPLLPSQIDE
jgi:hypothetical protein